MSLNWRTANEKTNHNLHVFFSDTILPIWIFDKILHFGRTFIKGLNASLQGLKNYRSNALLTVLHVLIFFYKYCHYNTAKLKWLVFSHQ
jgi:hypothetical protein